MKPAVFAGAIAWGVAVALAAPVAAQERPRPSGGSSRPAQERPAPSSQPSSPPPTARPRPAPSSPGPSSPSSATERSRRAVPRSGGSAPRAGAAPERSRVIRVAPATPATPDENEPIHQASPRPRGSRPAAGTATPRSESPVPDLRWRLDPYWRYGWWRYNRWVPVYYGPWGGYFYYDPFWWDYYRYGYYGGYYGGRRQYRYSEDDYGALRLKVKPRDAQVYVDGYFTGKVDDYDGVFQRLKLKAGGHRVELRAEGYLPAVFDVLIAPGETITYDEDLRRDKAHEDR